MRFLLIILLLLNALVFVGGSMGWLGPSATRGEPERLTNQLLPDQIKISAEPHPPPLPAPPPPPVAVAPRPERQVCLAYTVAAQASATEAESLARTLDNEVRVSRETVEEPTNWRVRIPPAANLTIAERRARVLRESGVVDLFLVREEGPNRFSISLGLFSSESHANQRLSTLRAQGIQDAQIVPGSPGRYRIEFRGPASILASLAARLESVLAEASKGSCTP